MSGNDSNQVWFLDAQEVIHLFKHRIRESMEFNHDFHRNDLLVANVRHHLKIIIKIYTRGLYMEVMVHAPLPDNWGGVEGCSSA